MRLSVGPSSGLDRQIRLCRDVSQDQNGQRDKNVSSVYKSAVGLPVRRTRSEWPGGSADATAAAAIEARPIAAARGLPIVYTSVMPWFFSGTVRMRLPVAAKNALRTAGAATQIVGSPTPPQNPPDGMMIDSTFGICAIRIES